MESSKHAAAQKRREEKPKVSPKEDLVYRIKGLEEAKMEAGMTRNDIAALDRVIAKLKAKQEAAAAPAEPKE